MTENAIGPSKAQRSGDGKPEKLNAANAAVMASIANATESMATLEELREQADASKPRPKANIGAADIKDVYTIESLIGMETAKQIPVMDWEQTIKAKKEVIVSSRYVAHRIERRSSDIEKLRILRYVLLLIEFHNSAKPKRNGSKTLPKREDLRAAMGGVPEALVESIKRKFSDAGVLSRFKVDLLITHICALSCLVDNYEVDMFDLQEDLKVGTKEMAKYFREIGAKVTPLTEAQRQAQKLEKAAAAQHRLAKLRLPLDFPSISFARGR